MSSKHLEIFLPGDLGIVEPCQLGQRHRQRRSAAISTHAWSRDLAEDTEVLRHHDQLEGCASHYQPQHKRPDAKLPPLPHALFLLPGAEGHPLLEGESAPECVSSMDSRLESTSPGLRGGLTALRFVTKLKGQRNRLLKRRSAAASPQEISGAARTAIRKWFETLCRETGSGRDDERPAPPGVARRGSIEMAEQFFFLASLTEAEREHWESLCSLGVVSPWDSVPRQQRYLLKKKQAAEIVHDEQVEHHKSGKFDRLALGRPTSLGAARKLPVLRR